MKILSKLAVISAGAAFVALGNINSAQALTFTETTDAGQTLGTAQLVNTQPFGTSLNSISGTNAVNDVDLFAIYLTGGQTFSATTIGGASFDTILSLFDANGLSLAVNDDFGNTLQSTLPTGNSSTAAPGTYYLAISAYPNFPNIDGQGILSGFPAIADYAGGNYTIALTGAQFSAATPVPFEFSPNLATVAFVGAWGAMIQIKRLAKNRKPVKVSPVESAS